MKVKSIAEMQKPMRIFWHSDMGTQRTILDANDTYDFIKNFSKRLNIIKIKQYIL